MDLQQGAAVQQDFFSYLLFVSFFPHLIAGPILHHKDIMPQFQRNRKYGLQINDLAIGFSWFIMGMFKKVILADHLSPTADAVFAAHGMVTHSTAWIGVLSYALQLYFDFSGYCDMALGLARMFSIDFPLNFASPYKAASIVEFWQRWHMTLTQYIGSYLYSPIQFWVSAHRQQRGKKVTRKAQATVEGFTQMILLPTVVTMFIAGIWHGAGLQFLVFGLLHGVYLSVNHAWKNIRHQRKIETLPGLPGHMIRGFCVLLTFSCVVLGQVFFRANSVPDAMNLLRSMISVRSVGAASVMFDSASFSKAMIVIGFIIVWTFPNTQQILARYKPALQLAPSDGKPGRLAIFWQPNLIWGMLLGVVLLGCLIQIQVPSTFLYFQF
ncbi:D-alanyl-lipoteichoic acid acyltransferase DltB (MBOAT superfamily) [Granulicella aggregans]|uniref:D-alanyl-lipoteichoic acid acyltransferase DltB (MBOAT superfamily) n=1 Tax=Granulicella aggregans TaxID=474949 RepID=A0A7W7ZHI5_9BACT|nr:D-alanyl-lipoteichoic acid acyltransferase DltB (MBOAT superfamily) [Granulicella aggregans]